MTTKQCKACKERKALDQFYDHKKDGKRAECKACHKARTIARRKERLATDPAYRERLRDYNREYHKERYENDPSFREHRLDYNRRYDHETDRAQRLENGDTWVYTYNARCKEVGVTPVIERFTRQDVIDRYRDGCYYCQHGEFEHLDHFIPVSQDGPHALENVRPSCSACNWAKSDTDPLEFAASSSAVDEQMEDAYGSN